MFSRRQSDLKMFPDREVVEHPTIIIRQEVPPKDFTFITDMLVGTYYLVIPKTAKEVFYIQLLTKNVDVFIPADGDGLILTRKALSSI